MQKTSPPNLFSGRRIAAHLRRAMVINKPDSDFLPRLAGNILLERLDATNRTFPKAVEIYTPFAKLGEQLKKSGKATDVLDLQFPIDEPENAMAQTRESPADILSLENGSANLVTSLFGLHWSNDLPGVFKQIHNSLAPDGLFLCVLPGDRTLKELRECLMEAEARLANAASLRVDPFGEVRQFGGLLQRAGFTLPVVDTELITVRYGSMFDLIDDLRAMGATSALSSPARFDPRTLFEQAQKLYRERYMDADGRIRASFELVFLSGWTPHASQQTALKPGSAKHQLKDFL